MIKFNHKNAKTFNLAMGMSDKRWKEVTEATQISLQKTNTTPEAIEVSIKELKKVDETDLVVIGYVIGAYHARNNMPGGEQALKLAVLKALLS